MHFTIFAAFPVFSGSVQGLPHLGAWAWVALVLPAAVFLFYFLFSCDIKLNGYDCGYLVYVTSLQGLDSYVRSTVVKCWDKSLRPPAILNKNAQYFLSLHFTPPPPSCFVAAETETVYIKKKLNTRLGLIPTSSYELAPPPLFFFFSFPFPLTAGTRMVQHPAMHHWQNVLLLVN